MDYKLEYMERLFAKISKKKTESYVISRIWHQLDDDRVKFVVQQYIRRTQDKYALADLYLPQLNILIEINEPFHKNNVEVDKIRNEEILSITHSKPIIIDCDNDIQEIHRQVTDVVQLIKQRISELGDSFKPWDDASTLTVEYHRNKGYLKVEDNECLRTAVSCVLRVLPCQTRSTKLYGGRTRNTVFGATNFRRTECLSMNIRKRRTSVRHI